MFHCDDEGRMISKTVPLEGGREIIAERMTHSIVHMPQGTGMASLEVDNLLKFKAELMEQKGIKVSIGDMMVKAAAHALTLAPELNASRENGVITYYGSVNIGMMAFINDVLMEPVIGNTQSKTIEEISAELKKTYEYLKKGKLGRVKLYGSTFSISNLGMYPMDFLTPLISPPLAAIMGIGRMSTVAGFREDGTVYPKKVIGVCLTNDHATADGVPVGRFLAGVKEALDDPWTYMYEVIPMEAAEE